MYYVLFLVLYLSDQNRLEQVKFVRDCGRHSQMWVIKLEIPC